MTQPMSRETLKAVWGALNAPSRRKPADLTATWSRFARDGWATEIDIEDALLLADSRLGKEGLKPAVFAAVLGLPWRWVYSRPDSRFDDPSGYQGLSAVDAAALLIMLQRLGFTVEPEGLRALLRPALKSAPRLSEEGLAVLFHDKSEHRTPPITLSAEPGPWHGMHWEKVKWPTGYRAEWAVDDDGEPLWLIVNAPKFRKRPEPKLTECPACGIKYMKGLPSDEKAHRKVHRLRLGVIDPKPDRKLAAAQLKDPLSAPWVDYRSPQWKHDLMYRRAFAFKREMGFDFPQWAAKPVDDPAPVGFLFSDDQSRVIGACAFRPTDDGGWILDWVWLCPTARRQGVLTRHWQAFRQRFGNFTLSHPLSDAMEAFLAKS